MAGIVGYKKTAWDGATAAQRAVLRTILNTVNLGVPVLGEVGGVEWYIFSDWRIDQKFVENLAWFNGILASITTSPERVYDVPEGDDPLTAAADAQGAVGWFTAREDLPPGWVPTEVVS